MIKFLKKLKGESGQTLVIAALFMVVLIGCAAIVVDYGMVASEKSDLQNAADAAALAGAQALPDETLAETTAENMALQYGVDSEVTFPEAGASQQIQVTCSTTASYSFARIFGNNSQDLSATAVAEKTMSGLGDGMEAFGYAVFYGKTSGTMAFGGNSISVYGNVHSNSFTKISGNSHAINGSVTSVKKGTIGGNSITITGMIQAPDWDIKGNGHNLPVPIYTSVEVIEMPDFSDTIYAQALAAGQVYSGNTTFSGNSITLDAPIYVDGNVTISGNHFEGTGFIFATGNIKITGNSPHFSSTASIGFYSEKNISVTGNSAVVQGIMYAPNGDVSISGNYPTVRGRIIGKSISISGNNPMIIADDGDLNCLATEESIRLIG